MPQRFVLTILALGFSLFSFSANLAASERSASPLLSDWQSNLRWTVDFSSRGVFTNRDSFNKNIVGLDLHKVFSSADRDIATLIFQPYIVNFSGSDSVPFFFDDRDTELTWRIANVNFMALASGAFNIRVGHFEVPFGLEQNLDTNGTLRQFSFAERGIKADWGVSINGVLPHWDYEIALSRGSGNDIDDRDDPYLFSGRIGTPAHKNFVAGFSLFDGRILGPVEATRRQRVGLDFAWYHNNWEMLAEMTAGEDDNNNTAMALMEASWRSNDESLHLFTQLKQQRLELASRRDSGSTWTVGAAKALPGGFVVSGQWSKRTDRIGAQKSLSELTLQLRYRL